jgi:hypothetical protein
MLGSQALGPCFGFHFGLHFWSVWGPFLGPKWCPKSDIFGFRFWSFFGSIFYWIWDPFWSPKRTKRDQDGFQKLSKRAIIAKRSDFEKVCFDMFFAGILAHQASQERPKTAKKASKTVPGSLPDLSKTCSILGSRFFDFRSPFWGPKRSPEEPKTKPKSGSKKLRFFYQFWTKNGAIFGPILGTLFGGFSG